MKNLKRLSKEERLKIVLDIVYKLKRVPANNEDGYIDMYKEEYSAIRHIKKVFNDYIKEEEHKLTEKSGKIFFEELNRTITYLLPTNKRIAPLFKMTIKNQ